MTKTDFFIRRILKSACKDTAFFDHKGRNLAFKVVDSTVMCYNKPMSIVEGEMKMAVSYKKLWHILLDRDMKKKDLAELAGLTSYAIKKLSKDEAVSTEVVGKICTALNCGADDIMEFNPD